MQVPLLQSMMSQISTGGIGLGEIVGTGDDKASGISQNMPVNPRKHSQVTKSLSSSMHSPFVQLMKSHRETLAVGVGETRTELEGTVETCKLELSVTVAVLNEGKDEGRRTNSELETEKVKAGELREGVGVRKGARRLSELEMTKRSDEKVAIGSGMVGVGVMRDGVEMAVSQKSPVNPAKH